MNQRSSVQEMSNEQLIDAFAEAAFEFGFETEREKELKAEILRRMKPKGGGGMMITIGQMKQAFVNTIWGDYPFDTEQICEDTFWEFAQTLTGVPYHHPLNIDESEYLEPKPDDDVPFAQFGVAVHGTREGGT